MEANNLYFLASDLSISQEKSNDIFMIVEMRMFSTRPNRNKQGVTEAFIDDIVANQEIYSCLPLYSDLHRLKAREYRGLTHMQSRITGTFGTTQIGGMRNFRRVDDEFGVSLIGEARIPKREDVVCERIMELYEMGDLNFSFELKYTEDGVVYRDGIMYVDASEHNRLIGMAVVSVPAYEESYALSLVAQDQSEVDTPEEEVNEGVEPMDKAENMINTIAAEETPLSGIVSAEEMQQEAVAETEACAAEAQTVAAELPQEEAKPEEASATAEAETSNAEAADTAVAQEEAKEEDQHEETEEPDEEKDEEEKDAEASLREALAQSQEECALWHAKYMELEAEIARKHADIAQISAEIERLRAFEVELNAIYAAKEAEELMNKQNAARAFAQKQGLDIQTEAVASAVESLDYTAIAQMAMAQDASTYKTVSVESYAVGERMQLRQKFQKVLERVQD